MAHILYVEGIDTVLLDLSSRIKIIDENRSVTQTSLKYIERELYSCMQDISNLHTENRKLHMQNEELKGKVDILSKNVTEANRSKSII